MKKQKVLMMVVAIVFVLGNVVPALAQTAGARLIVVNGTGAGITEFIISPSSEHYPKNSSCFALDDLKAGNGATFAVVLPKDMTGIGVFDIAITAGGKKFTTKKEVKIDFLSGKTPTLQLSTTDKDLIYGLKNAVPTLATAGFFATTRKIAPKAGAMALGSVLTKAGLSTVIPYIGWIVAGGIILVEGAFLLHDYVFAAGDLWVQVDYN